MLNKSQVISSLYALKYGFGKITFCKKDKKIKIAKEVGDLKTRTWSQQPGGNEMTWKQSLDTSERIFYMRHCHGGMVQSGIKEDSGIF